MKSLKTICMLLVLALMLTACSAAPSDNAPAAPAQDVADAPSGDSSPPAEEGSAALSDEDRALLERAVAIELSEDGILVDGAPAATEPDSAVYIAHDIVYYESGKDFTYGEGTEADAHSEQDAAAHTVVHIAEPGIYALSGTLHRGQIAVDLGDEAESDPEAVVTLLMNGADITCEVAPAVIFYNVYECGTKEAESAVKDVDTSAAGANVVLMDGTVNTVKGSYVARIYKPDSVDLNEDGTEVTDAKKLHKYDGAFYSRMSMNIAGGGKGTGEMTIYAENEGLDSELHLTINGGKINILSGNDGINTNEDGISVTTLNGGQLSIRVTGDTGEGDGIDSNGWLVINGGTLFAEACADSADAGIDSDMGIHINGGTVLATGHMLDRIEQGGQTYAVFNFAAKQDSAGTVSLQNAAGTTLFERAAENAYSILVFSSPALEPGTYSLLLNGTPLSGQASAGFMGHGMGGGMQMPDDMERPEPPEGMERPEGMEGMEKPDWPDGQNPFEGMEIPEGTEFPEPPEKPQDGQEPGMGGMRGPNCGGSAELPEPSEQFEIQSGGSQFMNIS